MKNKLMKLVTKLEQKISSKYPIDLLMLVERESYSNFRLLISSDTLKSDLATVSMVYKEISKMLTNDEFKIFSGVEVVDQRSDFFIEMRDYLENNGNPNEFYNLEFGGLKINRALVIISPVDNSRKYVRKAELRDLEKRLQDDGRLQLQQLVLMQLKLLAKFWNTHDMTEFEDQLEEVTEPVFEREKETVINLQLPFKDVAGVKKIAKSKGVDHAALIREWILEKLAVESVVGIR
jgi:predicted DNA binding CopG/RHH family protein